MTLFCHVIARASDVELAVVRSSEQHGREGPGGSLGQHERRDQLHAARRDGLNSAWAVFYSILQYFIVFHFYSIL